MIKDADAFGFLFYNGFNFTFYNQATKNPLINELLLRAASWFFQNKNLKYFIEVQLIGRLDGH